MKKIVFLLVIILLSFSDLEAKRRKRRKVKKKPVKEKEVYLEQEQKLFDKEFVYKKKYQRVYGAGIGVWGFRDDGIPDEFETTKKENFFGLSLLGRVDILREMTLFPALSYTFLDTMSDGEKVFTDKTKKLKYGFLTVDATYRFPPFDELELFAGGGLHVFYKKYEVNYSTSSPNALLSSSDTDYKAGLNGCGYAIYNVTPHLSFLSSVKMYLINPGITFGAQIGAIYNFSIKKRR